MLIGAGRSPIRWAPRTSATHAAVRAERVAAFTKLCASLQARIHQHLVRFSGLPRAELLKEIAGALATLQARDVGEGEITECTSTFDDATLATHAANLGARAELWLDVLASGLEVEMSCRARATGARLYHNVAEFRALVPRARHEILRAFYLAPPRPEEWVEDLTWARAPDFA